VDRRLAARNLRTGLTIGALGLAAFALCFVAAALF
jgi:hypothetical protein